MPNKELSDKVTIDGTKITLDIINQIAENEKLLKEMSGRARDVISKCKIEIEKKQNIENQEQLNEYVEKLQKNNKTYRYFQ